VVPLLPSPVNHPPFGSADAFPEAAIFRFPAGVEYRLPEIGNIQQINAIGNKNLFMQKNFGSTCKYLKKNDTISTIDQKKKHPNK
jgi:hypothetical protein